MIQAWLLAEIVPLWVILSVFILWHTVRGSVCWWPDVLGSLPYHWRLRLRWGTSVKRYGGSSYSLVAAMPWMDRRLVPVLPIQRQNKNSFKINLVKESCSCLRIWVLTHVTVEKFIFLYPSLYFFGFLPQVTPFPMSCDLQGECACLDPNAQEHSQKDLRGFSLG